MCAVTWGAGAIFIAVVACDDGNFHFFDRTGNALLVVPTGHGAPITALAHDFTDGECRCPVIGSWRQPYAWGVTALSGG